jgi:salicylate hydroxylase
MTGFDEMAASHRILIAGAGLGGLTAALSCLHRGMDVDVFEQAPDLKEVGAGVQISPTSLRVLIALGLEEQVMNACFNPVGRELRVWNTGYSAATPFKHTDMIERYGLPNITMHRADLHGILLDAVRERKADAVHVKSRVESFVDDGSTITLRIEDGRAFSGDALIGADGLHSRVRRQLFGASKPQFTGGIAWRGIIPMEKLPESHRTLNGQNWLGTNGHFVVYPIRRGELVNIVGHIERDDWQVETWTQAGTHAEIAADFAGWHEHVQALIENIEIPYKWAIFLHPTMEQWSIGRATLLGDACHPTLPYLAAGANMAIEDAFVLARCIERYSEDIPLALKRYEELRIPRTTRIVDASAANLNSYHHPDLGDPEKSRAYIDREAVKQRDTRQWLYDYDATTVAV